MKKIFRYVTAGVAATGTKIMVLYALTEWAGLWYLYSSAIGFSIALCISFTLQKFWTFQHGEMKHLRTEALQFMSVALGGLLFNAAVLYTLVEYVHLHYILAQLIAAVFLAFANFILYHSIFRAPGEHSLSKLWREELGPWERGLIIAGAVSFLLVVVKFFGIGLSYYQDEWKTAHFIVDPIGLAGLFHHPPLTELLYRIAGFLPSELFRLIPLFFTAASFGLLYLILERRAGFKATLLTIILVGTSAYGTLAALMLDLDGAILPFFMLLAVYAYDRAREHTGRLKILFIVLLLISLILGFLIKLSFVIVVGAIIVDYLFERRKYITFRYVLRLTGVLFAFLALVALVILAARFVYPAFSMSSMVGHALTYVGGFNRGWGQIAFQTFKAIIYTGPIVCALIFFRRDVWERTRFFCIYLALGFFFYFVLFDFSTGALDKYLMFTIVPLSAILGTILAPYLPTARTIRPMHMIAAGAGICALLAVNFLPQDVLPLYPKSACAKEVLSLHWNFLLPFFGVSGPLGFYVSFLFVALSFAAAFIFAALALMRPKFQTICTVGILLICFTYAGVFTEELFFGRINGSAPKVLNEALAFIRSSDDISSVITHNDIGAFELWRSGKYAGRFYAAPQFEEVHKKLFAEHTGHYLVVTMPEWNKDSFYERFFSLCTSLFESRSKAIAADVYVCTK